MRDVTALIIAYNARSTIERALKSAFSQVGSVILVDDCSIDGTADIAKSVVGGALKVIRNTQNYGTGGARQIAINSCESEYAIWLDADDMFLSGRVENALQILNSGADYVFDCAELYDGTNDAFIKKIEIPDFLFSASGLAYQIERNYVPSLGWGAVKTKIAQKIGYNPSLRGAEDYDHFLRAMLSGCDIKFSHAVKYRQYAYTRSVSRDVRKMNENVCSLLQSIDDIQVVHFLNKSNMHPAESKWIWCNYLVRQGRYEDLLNASIELETMIKKDQLEYLNSAPLPYSFFWKAIFCQGVALLSLNDYQAAELAFIKLNEIALTPEGLNNLGVAKAMQGHNGIVFFSKALTLKENFLDAGHNLRGDDFSITRTPLRVQASRDDYE